MPVTGGRKLKAILIKGGKGGVQSVRVGFFASARYEDGTSVVTVAASNEFGNKASGIPERPFMRLANAAVRPKLEKVLKARLNPQRMIVDETTAGLLGETLKGEIQESIRNLRLPPNAPSTIERKGGKSNPLIDTGFMRLSVSYEVKK